MTKFTLRTSLLSLSAAVLLGLSGCSGGGSSTADAVGGAISKAYGGIGIDGILVGSTVCIDVNENAVCDADEPTDPDGTDAQGKFEIPATTKTGPLLLIGGTDIGTGLPFTGALTAPAGSTVVTPLTSAVQSLVKSGKSPEEAEANIKAALGVPSDVNLTHFDPFDEVSANAQAVLASQAHLQTIVHAASVAVASADANQSTESVMGDVFAQVSQSFDGATADVNLSVEDVTAVTKSVANDLYADNQIALVSVKNNAEATAQSAVDAADATEATIKAGTPAEAEANLNTGITLVNTSIAADINSSTAASVDAADDLNATALQAIVDAQAEQEAKEAEIAAAVAEAKAAAEAEAQAAADYAAALAAADLEAQKAAYEELLEAQAEQLRQDEAERAARAAAEEAAALAAAQEAQLIADAVAAQAAADAAAAELAAAQAQAAADAAEAAARIAAAEAAAQAAQDASDLAAAQLAAENSERTAAVGIMKVQAASLVNSAFGYIAQVQSSIDSIEFIVSLDSNYSTDTDIQTALGNANSALMSASMFAGDANTSAESLYDYAVLVAAEANVTDANVTDANDLLQFVISAEASGSVLVVDAQTALDDTRAAVLVIKAAQAQAVADAAAEAEKQRVIALIQAALDSANDNNVSTDLSTIDSSILEAFADLNATLAIANEYPTLTFDTVSAQAAYDRALAAQSEAQSAAGDLNTSIAVINAELLKAQDSNATELLSQEEMAKAVAAAGIVTARTGEIAGIKTGLAEALVTAEGIEQAEILRLQGVAVQLAIQSIQAQIVQLYPDVEAAMTQMTTLVASTKSKVAAIQTIAESNPSAQSFADEALLILPDLADNVEFYLVDDFDALEAAKAEGLAAITVEDAESALTDAQDAAFYLTGEDLDYAIDYEAQAQALLESAQSANNPTAVAGGISEGMVFAYVEENKEEVKAKITTIGATTFSEERLVLNEDTGDFDSVVGYVNDDLVLNDSGNWVTPSNTFSIVNGNVVMDSGDIFRLAATLNLATPATPADIAAVAAINEEVPGDANVTFNTGALGYVFASQRGEKYEVSYTPGNCDDWNQTTDSCNVPETTFSTLVEFMNSDQPVAGSDATGDWVGVYFKQVQGSAVDSADTVVTSLSVDQNGSLVLENGTTAGTWNVIALPNTMEVAIVFSVDSAYTDDEDNLLAVVSGEVRQGTHTGAMTEFETHIGDVDLNQQALMMLQWLLKLILQLLPQLRLAIS